MKLTKKSFIMSGMSMLLALGLILTSCYGGNPDVTDSPEVSESIADSGEINANPQDTSSPESSCDIPAVSSAEASDSTAGTEPVTPADTGTETGTDMTSSVADEQTEEPTGSETSEEIPVTDTEPAVTETEKIKDNFTFTLSFAGDIQLCDNWNYAKQDFTRIWATVNPSHYFSKVYDIFAADDYTLLNLEYVVTDRELSRAYKGSGTAYWYKGPTETLSALTCSSVEGVSLTNNHVGDYGDEGQADTLAAVLAAGLDAGTYTDTIYVEKNGYTVAIICDAMWYSGHKYDILPRLSEAQTKSDFQIVYWHGGSAEYQRYPDSWEIQVCHELVDAGADLVIGNHPHVLQTMEEYKGVRILYSLGNFCYAGMMLLNKATVIYQVQLTISPEGLMLEKNENIIPCYYYGGYLKNPVTGTTCQNFQPCPITNEAEIAQVFAFLNGKATSPMLQ